MMPNPRQPTPEPGSHQLLQPFFFFSFSFLFGSQLIKVTNGFLQRESNCTDRFDFNRCVYKNKGFLYQTVGLRHANNEL